MRKMGKECSKHRRRKEMITFQSGSSEGKRPLGRYQHRL
jgi:hypothetical protein